MSLILFWIVGVLSLLAGLLAVAHPRPLRSTQGLVALMAANSILFLMLSATLLAIELLTVNLGAAALVWFVLVRPKRMKLGSPGRLRLNITKFIAMFVAIWVCALLWWAVAHGPQTNEACGTGALLSAEVSALLAVFLLGVSGMTAILVVVTRRREDDREPTP